VNEQVHHTATELYLLQNEPVAGRQQLLRTHRPPFGVAQRVARPGWLPEAGRAGQAPCQDSVQQANRVARISSARKHSVDLPGLAIEGGSLGGGAWDCAAAALWRRFDH
jgi:hypothetical protein